VAGLTAAGTDQRLDWIIRAVREFENASAEDPGADSHSANATVAATRQVDVTSPTAANLGAVLASLFADLRKRGGKKST
jgi:hypothetical protein